MDATLRAFIALELPEKVIRSIERLQGSLKSHGLKLRWVHPAGIHLTLKFLGDIAASEIAQIADAMGECAAGFAPLTLSARGIGVFPDLKRPRVMWAGLSGQTDELARLQERMDEKLAAIGYPKERRTYRGHLTLARARGRMDLVKFMEAIKNHDPFASEPFIADQIILFKSELRPSGAVYTKLVQVDLSLRR